MFKIDSGAQVNIIPFKGPLKNTNIKLSAYNGTSLKVHDMIRLKCGYDSKQSYQGCYVVDSPFSPILG
ncbi:hypothetical protein DPMN_040547 [Dreissena polymorpha]|uniref:Uncharacterized protein n=1 Tax=Dreissena polymorpha TaxID=45954 RepID=A0A9D4HV53_DREPO|nr:hypothetical protein DPMN_040547 [Dreissena polymorpha]